MATKKKNNLSIKSAIKVKRNRKSLLEKANALTSKKKKK